MSQIGQVETIEQKTNMLTILFKRTQACERCKACGMMGNDKMQLKAKNDCNAAVGDWVYVELSEGFFAGAVMIMYGFPLVMLVIGILGGTWLFERLTPGMAEPLGIVSGLVLMCLSFLWIKSREGKRSEGFLPRAVKIVDAPKEQ